MPKWRSAISCHRSLPWKKEEGLQALGLMRSGLFLASHCSGLYGGSLPGDCHAGMILRMRLP